jgi:hypothetical protein
LIFSHVRLRPEPVARIPPFREDCPPALARTRGLVVALQVLTDAGPCLRPGEPSAASPGAPQAAPAGPLSFHPTLCSQSSCRNTLLRWSATLVFQNVGRPSRAEPGCHSGSLHFCSLPGSLSSRLLRQSSRCRDCQWIVPCFGSCEAFNCVSASWRAASANVRNSRSQISSPGRAFTYATLVLTSARGLLRGSAADRASDGLPDGLEGALLSKKHGGQSMDSSSTVVRSSELRCGRLDCVRFPTEGDG